MSIIAKQQICIYINSITCLASYPMGRYALQFFLHYKHNQKNTLAIPISIIDEECPNSTTAEIIDHLYRTKHFPMKPQTTVRLNELCVFKNQVNIFQYEPDYKELQVAVVCELVRVDSNKDQVLGTFEGVLNGVNSHDALLIDFGETAACQIRGTIHSCIYQYEYQSKSDKFSTLEEYCQVQSQEYVGHLLKYLTMEGKINFNHIQQAFEEYSPDKEHIKEIDMEIPMQSILDQNKQRDLFKTIKEQSRYFSIEEPELMKVQKDLETRANQPELSNIEDPQKRKRKKIFGDRKEKVQKYQKVKEKEKKFQNIENFEKQSYQNSVKIYSKWRELINLLNIPEFQPIMAKIHESYLQKMKKLMGESVVRFKGSWDIDLYANQIPQRNKVALQARTFLGQTSKDNNEFCFYNKNFFSHQRPIFFQEFVDAEEDKDESIIKEKEETELALIILVHGLGACRLDMQKVKVEIKRYFGKKVHILVSMSNQGRTEGDIDAMGVRLAMEVDHEIAKFKTIPPITFIGHSMGGVIIRSALPRLLKHAEYFNSYISLSTPHIGYTYSSSKLIDAGLWLLNHWKKCQAILQLTMSDQKDPKDSFMYKLSQADGLQYFRQVAFFSSHQDLYVPYYSARIQKHQDCLKDCKNNKLKGKIHNEMIDSILNNIKGKIVRTDVNFCIPQQNLDNLIGRAAHISFIQNVDMLRILCLTGQNIIF